MRFVVHVVQIERFDLMPILYILYQHKRKIFKLFLGTKTHLCVFIHKISFLICVKYIEIIEHRKFGYSLYYSLIIL